ATRIRMGTASEAARKAARTRKRRRTRRYRTPSLRLLRRALLYALPLGDCERLDIPIACALASSSSSVDSRAVARMTRALIRPELLYAWHGQSLRIPSFVHNYLGSGNPDPVGVH